MRRPLGFWIDVTLKAALVALLLFSVFSGLERFEGKAMAGRALTYPLAAVIVPVGWWLFGRRRGGGYPYALETADEAAYISGRDRAQFVRALQEFAEREHVSFGVARKAISKAHRR